MPSPSTDHAPRAGLPLPEARLPPALRDHVSALRAEHERGAFERLPGGARFADGSLWFANAYEVKLTAADTLAAAIPGLGIFATLGLGIYTYYQFDEQLASRWICGGVTLLTAIAAGTAMWWHRGRSWRAVERMELGTLILDDYLVIISRGRYLPFERSSILRHDLARRGDAERAHVIRYRTPRGQALQELTGFANNPAAVKTLDQWIAKEPRSDP